MNPNDIGCVIKSLPDVDKITAAATAVNINPANRPRVERARGLMAFASRDESAVITPYHLALLTTKYWGAKGVNLTVGFTETIAADLRERILSHMNAWSVCCNAKFSWSKTSPQVRITRSGDGYWSYLGTDILHIPADQPTMCLQDFTMSTPESEYKRVVRHEVGHTLGFPHEHMRQEIVSRLDEAKTIAWGRSQLGWDVGTVRQQILTPIDPTTIQATPAADVDSIMCYQLPASITKNGKPIPGGLDINANDQAFAGKLYPLAVTPPPASTRTIVITGASKVTVDGNVV